MRYVIHTDRDIAQKECDVINEATRCLWKDGVTQNLVCVECNFDNTLFMYMVVDEYKFYYTKEAIENAIEVLPTGWCGEDEVFVEN